MALPSTVFRDPDFMYFVGPPSSRVIFSFMQEELVPLHHVRYGLQEGEKGTEEVKSEQLLFRGVPEIITISAYLQPIGQNLVTSTPVDVRNAEECSL